MPVSEVFVDESRRYLTGEYLPAIRKAIEPLTDEDLWWRPNDGSNSIGNLVLHLTGNVRQWIVSGLGGAPDTRLRQTEFDARGGPTRQELLDGLAAVIAEADRVLAALPVSALLETRTIQGKETGVLAAIYHVVEHFSGHVGQILWVSKMRRGV